MATIQATLGAASIANPYYISVRITKQLCNKTSMAPVFNPVFTLVSYRTVGTDQYEAIVNVQGIATYTPCGKCCAKSQTVNENFVIPFYSATTPESVTVSGGAAVNTLVSGGCCSCCSNTFVSDVPVTLTITNT